MKLCLFLCKTEKKKNCGKYFKFLYIFVIYTFTLHGHFYRDLYIVYSKMGYTYTFYTTNDDTPVDIILATNMSL